MKYVWIVIWRVDHEGDDVQRVFTTWAPAYACARAFLRERGGRLGRFDHIIVEKWPVDKSAIGKLVYTA